MNTPESGNKRDRRHAAGAYPPSSETELIAVREFHRPLPIRPRLLALETPDSYLRALIAANHLSSAIKTELTRQAKQANPGIAGDEIYAIIAETKGRLQTGVFQQARNGMPKHDDHSQCPRCCLGIEHRYMCRLCSAGRTVEQYPHLKANVCTRHHLWVGPGTAPANQVKVGEGAVAADLIFQRLRNQKALDAPRYMELRAIFRRWSAADSRETASFEDLEPRLYPLMMATSVAVLRPAELKKILDPRATYASAYKMLHTALSKHVLRNTEVLTDAFWMLLRPAFLSVRERIESGHTPVSLDPHSIRIPDVSDLAINQVMRPLEPFSRYLDQLETCDADRWQDLNQRLYDYGPLPVIHEKVPKKSSAPANYICERGHRHQKAPNTMASAMKQNRKGCPYCTNALPLAGYNTLAETNPSLATEWHPSLNNPVTQSDIIAGGNSTKYWWLCPRGHTYRETPNNLSRPDRRHCPYCSGRLPIPGETTLDVTNPRLASEWATELNGSLTPAMASEGSGMKVWWLCPKGHTYLAKIALRKRTGCPYCANLKVWRGYNDLATTHPRLAAEWHPTLNTDLKPTDIVAGTHRRIWWLCPRHHAYQSAVDSRASTASGCPYCANQRIWPGYNDLATVASGVASQWHYDANVGLKPTDVGAGTPRKVWWLCPAGHSYQAAVNGRVAGSGCPECYRLKRARHK